MIWTLLLMLGVPLWLCVLGISVFIFRNRKLRKREGDIPARLRLPGRKRWMRGHAIWVSDVLAWRGSPAAWRDEYFHVSGVAAPSAGGPEGTSPRWLGDEPEVVELTTVDGRVLGIATRSVRRSALWGPFADPAEAGTVDGTSGRPAPAITHLA